MTIGVYAIRNIINNKSYIGSSIDIQNRWRQHLRDLKKGNHKAKYLQNAFNKYGESNFEFFVLEEIENKNELLKKEQYYLDIFQSYDSEYGYNTNKSTTAGRLGLPHSDETKRKISEYFKGKKLSKDHRQKVINGLIGRKVSDETRAKISEKNRKFNEDEVEEIIKLYDEGKTYKEISIIMGCVKTTIFTLFKKLFADGKVRKRKDINKLNVTYYLENTSLSQKEIAVLLNLSQATVTKIKYNKEKNK